ncbi:transposase [Brachybacterium sp. EF45031]|nr:transposase [Brachybacterium sillae]
MHLLGVTTLDEGTVRVDVETDVDLTGCPDCGVVAVGHGRRVQVLHDAPCFGRPVRVWWRKRIWRCPEPSCPRSTWTEEHPYAPARAKLTTRATAWAVDALRHDDTTVSAIARHLGVAWDTCWSAIKTAAQTRIADPARLGSIKTIGVDEHIWRPSRISSIDKAVTVMVDLTRDDFWTEFLRSLRERGLTISTPASPEGVLMVTSDAHSGLKHAIKAVLPGASWQRCRVHFARNITQALGSARSKPVNALVSTIFAQTSPETVRETYQQVTASLENSFPQVAAMLKDAEADLTAFAAFPIEHWRKIWSNNPIERVNREIKRRADVVQIFPSRDSATRLVGAVLQDQHEEWQYGERRYISDISLRRLADILTTDTPENNSRLLMTA